MPVTIIAEAGVNHNGDLETAKRMAYVAKECGADIVKYQTAVPELVVSRFAEKAEYQKQTTDAAESQLEMIRKLHFSFEGHRELKEYCDSIGIQYLSAPFDIPSVRFLGTLGMPLIKIPSGEITNLPYLEEIGKLRTPALLSTGMCNLSEITDALGILDDNGCPEVTILDGTGSIRVGGGSGEARGIAYQASINDYARECRPSGTTGSTSASS